MKLTVVPRRLGAAPISSSSVSGSPRENAWLEFVELQDSAYPFHDWNERITAECYAPNGTSRILDGYQNIEKITNNYAHISFNFGPTLLAWRFFSP